MKKIIAFAVLLMASFFLFTNEVQAEEQPERHIAVHDRVLSFEKGEVRMMNGQMVARLEPFMAGIYAEVTYKDPIITIKKNNDVFTYNRNTGAATRNDVLLAQHPFVKIDGQIYVYVRQFSETVGFKVDYLSEILTARLTRTDYPSSSHEDFIHTLKGKAELTGPTVYLTFDDGPNEFTKKNMDLLKKHGVKGTFFFVGKQITSFPDIVKMAAKDGHTLGVHSMTHDKSKVYASTKNFIGEMNSARSLVQQLTGIQPVVARAPYGSKPFVTTSMRSELAAGGYKLWDWDVDSNDWRYKESEYRQIIANVKEGVKKSVRAKDQHIVILLHDRAQTVKAMPEILEWLKKEGYRVAPYDPANHVVQNFWQDKSL